MTESQQSLPSQQCPSVSPMGIESAQKSNMSNKSGFLYWVYFHLRGLKIVHFSSGDAVFSALTCNLNTEVSRP